jgi:integrase
VCKCLVAVPTGILDPPDFFGLNSQVRQALEVLKLTKDPFRRVRTIYSLRHTYAMNRLAKPDARYDLIAKNMGTSVEMLIRHYGSHLDVLKWMEVVSV